MKQKVYLTVLVAGLVSGCQSIANYDVPQDPQGDLTVNTIVQRISCELALLVNGSYRYQRWLIEGDYNVAINLSLSVNNRGSINPTFSYIDSPFLSLGGGFTLSRTREHNFFKNLKFSMRQLAQDVHQDPSLAKCPAADTPLAGDLGLRQAVTMAITSPYDTDATSSSSTTGAFGGFINIVSTKSLDGTGFTFANASFRGPGGFLGASEANTDKISFAFAEGANAGTKFVLGSRAPTRLSPTAQNFLNQVILNDIATQLSGIRNFSR